MAKINESLVYSKSYDKTGSCPYSEIHIYQNGYLNQSLLSSNGTFNGTNEFRVLVNISTYQEDEAGEYFVIVYAHPCVYARGCWSYFRFIDLYLSDYLPIRHVETLQIHTTGNSLLHIIIYCLCLMSCIITMVNLL